MISWLFGDIMYYLALAALFGGVAIFVVGFFAGIFPLLKAHALLIKVAGAVLFILGGYYVSDHHGYQRRVDEDKAEIERLNGEARAKEVELGQKLARATSQLKPVSYTHLTLPTKRIV